MDHEPQLPSQLARCQSSHRLLHRLAGSCTAQDASNSSHAATTGSPGAEWSRICFGLSPHVTRCGRQDSAYLLCRIMKCVSGKAGVEEQQTVDSRQSTASWSALEPHAHAEFRGVLTSPGSRGAGKLIAPIKPAVGGTGALLPAASNFCPWLAGIRCIHIWAFTAR